MQTDSNVCLLVIRHFYMEKMAGIYNAPDYKYIFIYIGGTLFLKSKILVLWG